MVFVKGQIPWNLGERGRKYPAETRKKMSLSRLGEKSPRWKGDNVGYGALHSWITRQKGTPLICEHCHRKNKRKYEWANISHKYKRDVNDFIRLCTRCHRRYDLGMIVL